MLNALANLAIRRSRAVIVTAVLASVVAGALGRRRRQPPGSLRCRRPRDRERPGRQSARRRRLPGPRRDRAGAWSRRLLAADQAAGRVAGARASPRIQRSAASADYYTTGSRDFVSADGHSTYLAVALKPTDDKEQQDAAKRIADRLDGAPGVTLGGPALAQEQVNKQVENDLRTAELLAFPLLFLLSLLFFRSVVAALLPLLIGGLAIVGTFLMLRVASELTSVSIFALNLVTGLGLGPGDRLQPVHGLALPRGDRPQRARARGDAADAGHRRADRSSSPR